MNALYNYAFLPMLKAEGYSCSIFATWASALEDTA